MLAKAAAVRVLRLLTTLPGVDHGHQATAAVIVLEPGLLLGVVAARQLVVVYAVKQLLAAQALGHHASRPRWLGPRSCLRIAIKNTMREA